MLRIAIIVFTAFLFSAEYTIAQVLNVESFRSRTEPDTTVAWSGETAFDVSIRQANNRIFRLGNQTNASYFTGTDRYLFLTNVELINVDGSSVISNGHFHLRVSFRDQEKISPELFAQLQYDENRGLKQRVLNGAGIRYTFLDREYIRGSFVTGLMFEYEKWGLGDDEEVENNFLKSTSSLVVRGQLNPQTQLLVIGYYQARPDKFFSPRVTSENQLNMRISDRLTYRVNFTLTYDTDPVIDIPKLIYNLRNGIVISF